MELYCVITELNGRGKRKMCFRKKVQCIGISVTWSCFIEKVQSSEVLWWRLPNTWWGSPPYSMTMDFITVQAGRQTPLVSTVSVFSCWANSVWQISLNRPPACVCYCKLSAFYTHWIWIGPIQIYQEYSGVTSIFLSVSVSVWRPEIHRVGSATPYSCLPVPPCQFTLTQYLRVPFYLLAAGYM